MPQTDSKLSADGASSGSKSIQITERALARIRAALAHEGLLGDQAGLRLELSGGGCAGLNYELRFEDAPQSRDRILNFGDLRLFVAPKSFIYLAGSVLDWEESRGFSVADPNWPNPCGCGSTIAAKPAF
jgi:iron-sulfur cluster assembly protein